MFKQKSYKTFLDLQNEKYEYNRGAYNFYVTVLLFIFMVKTVKFDTFFPCKMKQAIVRLFFVRCKSSAIKYIKL